MYRLDLMYQNLQLRPYFRILACTKWSLRQKLALALVYRDLDRDLLYPIFTATFEVCEHSRILGQYPRFVALCISLSRLVCISRAYMVVCVTLPPRFSGVWHWALMLLLLRDYATFDYAK